MTRIRIFLVCVLLSATSVWGQFEVRVGRGGQSWLVAADSLAFVNMAPDSLWTWPVAAGENLLANALGRGGRILVSVLQESFNPFGEPMLWPVFRDDITAVAHIASRRSTSIWAVPTPSCGPGYRRGSTLSTWAIFPRPSTWRWATVCGRW